MELTRHCYHHAALQGTIEGLGAEIPGPTAFVLSHFRWLYPTVFVGAGIGVIAKELWIHDKRLSVGITFVIALGVLWTSDYFKTVLFYPLLRLMRSWPNVGTSSYPGKRSRLPTGR